MASPGRGGLLRYRKRRARATSRGLEHTLLFLVGKEGATHDRLLAHSRDEDVGIAFEELPTNGA